MFDGWYKRKYEFNKLSPRRLFKQSVTELAKTAVSKTQPPKTFQTA